MNPVLSICIPSYNREKFLPDLLESIVRQYTEIVEIVICDNASADRTESLVGTWKKKYPRIVYERFEKNVGPDRCFLRSIEMAKGTFCWLMGDDDIIEPGGIRRVLDALDEKITGITVNRRAYDKDLKNSWIEPSEGRKEDLLFSSAEECFLSVFTLFGFLSAQVVRRSSWLSVCKEEDVTPYFNAYALIYVIGRMIQKDPSWLYLHTPCVGWRSGNDSFAFSLGRYCRFTLDVKGYSSIAKGLFTEDKALHNKVMNQVISLHFLGHARDVKFKGEDRLFASLVLCFSKLYPFRAFWLKLLPFLFFSKWLLVLFRPVYRKGRELKKNLFAITAEGKGR
jgi:abequosyltransferase